jgi:thioredoxin reductase
MAPSAIVPIIGGGPAGMSCALWLKNFGLRPVIIERADALGGMARRNPYPNPWLLGWPQTRGRDQAEAFARHLAQVEIETRLNARPERLSRTAGGFALELAGAAPLASPALVIATGTTFRGEEWLDAVPNARALAAHGRVHIGAVVAGEPDAPLKGRIAIVGGGDNAFEVAHFLAERGEKVTILMRGGAPRAQPRLVAQLGQRAAVRTGCTVAALDAAGDALALRLADGTRIDADHVVLLLGYRPNTDMPWLGDLDLAKDEAGYLQVDGNMETSCPLVFAVGDVVNPAHPCVATALASGTMAAREIARRLGGG